jgi:starvation-inducible DNA-binding protein
MDFQDVVQKSHEPLDVKVGMPEDQRRGIANGLNKVLSDTYVLLGKTHGFHWNVTGPHFHSLHEMFEDQYRDLVDAVDDIAERIRALGFFAPGSLSQFLKYADIEDEHGVPDAEEMIRQLARDNELLSRTCRAVVELTHKADDTVTEDLMNERMAAHDKAAWMLRATLR